MKNKDKIYAHTKGKDGLFYIQVGYEVPQYYKENSNFPLMWRNSDKGYTNIQDVSLEIKRLYSEHNETNI